MNPAVVFFGAAGYKPKRMTTIVLVSLVIIVALPGIALASLGSDALNFLADAPDAKTAETQGFYMGGAVLGNSYAWGNCTYWVFAMRHWASDPIPTSWGNANTWDDRAKADDYIVDHTPSVNAIFQTDAGDFGHVAYVTTVDTASGDWTISEMNAPHLNVVSKRTFSHAAAKYYTFIHDKKGAAPWMPSQAMSIPSLVTGN